MKLKHLFESEYGNGIKLLGNEITELPDDLPEKITGNFFCTNTNIKSLANCPREVIGRFNISRNDRLKTLEHGPISVGEFICDDGELKSLSFAPQKVGKSFSCEFNKLTSLEGFPVEVGGDILLSGNKLTSLDHLPMIIHGDLNVSENKIRTLQDVHKKIKKVGSLDLMYDPIKSHILGLMLIEVEEILFGTQDDDETVNDILNKWKNQGRKGVLGCQRELIDAGYRDLAQL